MHLQTITFTLFYYISTALYFALSLLLFLKLLQLVMGISQEVPDSLTVFIEGGKYRWLPAYIESFQHKKKQVDFTCSDLE